MIRESQYKFRWKGDTTSIIVTWDDAEREDGTYEILNVSGPFVALTNFQCSILNSESSRLGFNAWLRQQIK